MKRLIISAALAVASLGSQAAPAWDQYVMVEIDLYPPGIAVPAVLHIFPTMAECKKAVLPYVQRLQAKDLARQLVVTPMSDGVVEYVDEKRHVTSTVSCAMNADIDMRVK